MQKGALPLRNTKISLDALDFNVIIPPKDTPSNTKDIEKMRRFLRQAINEELTPKQRFCLCERYYNHRKAKEIAQEMNINPSGVTRHIQRAVAILKHSCKYYYL